MAIEAACTSIVSPYFYDEYVVCGDKRKALGLVYVVCGIDNVLPLYESLQVVIPDGAFPRNAAVYLKNRILP